MYLQNCAGLVNRYLPRLHPLGLSVLLACWLAACTSLPRLSPAQASGRQLFATQAMQVHSGGQTFDALCLIELTADTMRLVATTPQGQTLLKAELSASNALQTELAPWLAQTGLQADAIARDIQIALWPADALRQAGWEVTESTSGLERSIHLNGERWALITYQGGQKRPQHIEIRRGDGLYSVDLRTIEWVSP